MSRYSAHAEDWCGFSTASTRASELATAALDGDQAQVRKAELEEVAEALDTLDSCRRHDCQFHAREGAARALLQALVDADEAREAELDQQRIDHAEYLNECSGLTDDEAREIEEEHHAAE